MKKKLTFVFDHKYQDTWKDGLYAALMLLSYDFNISFENLSLGVPRIIDADFILGWGAFGSSTDRFIRNVKSNAPKGLCIAGNARPPYETGFYDILFYETDWYLPYIEAHPNKVKAFGVNTKIYKPKRLRKFWDYLTVGAFALWKRQRLMLGKSGYKIAVGEIQKDNPRESLGIVAQLLAGGVEISDMVAPERLCDIYNMSKTMYMPSDIFGGGERAVLEARSCGVDVEIEPDNPKLQELLNCELPTEEVYCEQLRKGVLSCL